MKHHYFSAKSAYKWRILLVIGFLLIGLSSVFAQRNYVYSGIVSNDKGETLPGATVVIKGTTIGATTDMNGKFSFTSDKPSATLVVTFIGAIPQEIEALAATPLNVALKFEAVSLSEVVVVGYGTQKKSVVTGSISSVKASDLENLPAPRLEDALKGRTSGVTVASSSGMPGAASTISIRGVTSINGSSPLYVVDGIPVYEGSIDFLNQSDIESIEVLKDAASAAIYGTQAAAGVILVTTKKGVQGKMQVNYSGYFGMQNRERKVNLCNATEYATLRNEASLLGGGGILFPNPSALGEGTDWQDVIFAKNAGVQNHELSISGGKEKSTYYASFGYYDQNGIVAPSITNYKRISVRLNSSHQVNKWLNFGNNISYSHVKSQSGTSANDYYGGLLASAINLDPITPLIITDPDVLAQEPYASHLSSLVRDDDGNPYGISYNVGQEMTNPAAYVKTHQGNFGWGDNVVGNFFFEVMPVKGLTLRSSVGGKLSFWGNESYSPIYFLSNTNSNLDHNSFQRELAKALDWTFTNTATYVRKFGEHNLTLLLGTEGQDRSGGNGIGVTYINIPVTSFDQANMNYSITAENRPGWGYDYQPYRLSSLFGRLNYEYAEKYLFTGILRRDGSSHFGSNNVYGLFPSASLGWIVSNEDFWPKNNAINLLKLRFGYGVNGNDNLPAFRYTSTIGSIGSYVFGNDQIYTGYGPQAPANPDLRWEQTSQLNFGVDATFLKYFGFVLELFKKNTKDMLLTVKLPGYVGASGSPYGNIAAMENKGVEAELSYRRNFDKLKLNFKGNVAYIKNKITDIGVNDFLTNASMIASTYEVSRKMVGEPINFFYGFKTDGVFQTQEEINAYVNSTGQKVQPDAVPGDFKWQDLDGDGSITDKDRTNLGNPIPPLTYGFTANVSYGPFDLLLFSQGVYGNKIFQQLRRLDILSANYMNAALGRWTGPGTSTDYPRLIDGANKNFTRPSNFYLEDGAYFRIKTLQVGYNLPKKLAKEIGIVDARVYLSGNNLLTLTKYSGYDPEIGGGQGIFSIDRGVYPQARSFLLGINFTF